MSVARGGCQDAHVPNEMKARRRDLPSEAPDQLKWSQDDAGGRTSGRIAYGESNAIFIDPLELFFGKWGPSDVSTELLASSAIFRRDPHLGVNDKPVRVFSLRDRPRALYEVVGGRPEPVVERLLVLLVFIEVPVFVQPPLEAVSDIVLERYDVFG